MFDVDKIINVQNKKMLYGDKPELPEKLENVQVLTEDGECAIIREPNIKEITETINKILEYLKWMDK